MQQVETSAAPVERALAQVVGILGTLGVDGASPDAVLTAPADFDGPVLIRDAELLGRFCVRFAVGARFVGYQANDLAFLTLREVAELYVAESHPELPTTALVDEQYALYEGAVPLPATGPERDIPIAFVLGCGRSGTTLLRTMLDRHPELWSPGELHLANYAGMADRARRIPPSLRYMPLPEIAARAGGPLSASASTFRRWERENAAIADVYAQLHAADPNRRIVDKTPSYSTWAATLERIASTFPAARYVHLIRSPHDVIRSLVRMQLYKGSLDLLPQGLNPHHVAEILWTLHNENIGRFLEGQPREQHCLVRYEDLVAAPSEALARICTVLGVDFDEGMADPYRTGERKGRVALGAGDMTVNLLDRVEVRTPCEAFYPIGERTARLATRHGYG